MTNFDSLVKILGEIAPIVLGALTALVSVLSWWLSHLNEKRRRELGVLKTRSVLMQLALMKADASPLEQKVIAELIAEFQKKLPETPEKKPSRGDLLTYKVARLREYLANDSALDRVVKGVW
ncbi:hypothetical protein ACN9MU_04695 [Pseudoduganella sp. R-32]|uniref:hypothetical protein n=1 Tax=Pseudoduganella sp. R-32 TaxID=3404061 RepID=UPI003CFB3AB9